MKKKANIYIVKRRHFKVRSKKARYERDSLKSSHACKPPAGVQIISLYVQLYTHSTRTHAHRQNTHRLVTHKRLKIDY